MDQKKLLKASQDQGGLSSDLKRKFEEIKDAKTTRVVKLLFKSCCGCGCSDVTVLRTVDAKSNLKDGDRIYEVLKTDEVL